MVIFIVSGLTYQISCKLNRSKKIRAVFLFLLEPPTMVKWNGLCVANALKLLFCAPEPEIASQLRFGATTYRVRRKRTLVLWCGTGDASPRLLLGPASKIATLMRDTRIELVSTAWEAVILPLN